jgi:hypothetical protein
MDLFRIRSYTPHCLPVALSIWSYIGNNHACGPTDYTRDKQFSACTHAYDNPVMGTYSVNNHVLGPIHKAGENYFSVGPSHNPGNDILSYRTHETYSSHHVIYTANRVSLYNNRHMTSHYRRNHRYYNIP